MDSILCPVCESGKVVRIRKLPGQRTGNKLILRGCRSCHSLFNPSDYSEDDARLQSDVKYLSGRADIASRWAEILVGKLRKISPEADTFLDLGCGIGTLVRAAKAAGFEAQGIDLNPYAVDYGKKKYGVDLLYGDIIEHPPGRYDVITCNHVFEHLKRPRRVFEAALGMLNRPGLIFLSMPFRKQAALQLKYILFPNLSGTPFNDNDVHITHFSRRSIRLWAEEYGAKSCIHSLAGLEGFILSFE